MRWLIVFLLFTLLRPQTCKKQAGVKLPPCIVDKIEAIQQQPKYNPPATVYRYLYAGSGGFTGKGDSRCSNFKEMATDETLVWKDAR